MCRVECIKFHKLEGLANFLPLNIRKGVTEGLRTYSRYQCFKHYLQLYYSLAIC